MRQPRLTRGWISGPSRPKRNTALSVLWRNSIKPDANVAFLGKESKYLRSTAYKAEPEAPFLVYPRHRKCTQTFWKNVKPFTQFSLLLQNPVVIRLADVLLEAVGSCLRLMPATHALSMSCIKSRSGTTFEKSHSIEAYSCKKLSFFNVRA